MTEDSTPKADRWFVDAWAVRDGAIFASKRSPLGRDAESTVFICVPDLAAVPVGRQSTALAATRRQFQEGLTEPRQTDEPAVEIPFEDLEQIREIVRRGYLGGGLGPGGDDPVPGADDDGGAPPSPIADPAGPAEPTPDDGAALLRGIDIRVDGWRDGPTVAADLGRIASDFRNPGLGFRHQLFDAVNAYTAAVTLDWELRFERNRSAADGQLLKDWYDVQSSMDHGLAGHLARSAGSRGLGVGAALRHRDEWSNRWNLGFGSDRPWNIPTPSLGAIVGAAPCPSGPNKEVQLRRLREAALLPMVDPNHWVDSRSIFDLAPAVVAALVLTSSMTPGASLQFLGQDWNISQGAERVATALDWLVAQMPTVTLPEQAEMVMSTFIERQLDGPEAPIQEPQKLL